MTGACEGDGNGEGTRPCRTLISGTGLGKFSRGFDGVGVAKLGLELETCALATVIGATATMRITRAVVSGRMMSRPIAVPRPI
jgi:hypothetical protein